MFIVPSSFARRHLYRMDRVPRLQTSPSVERVIRAMNFTSFVRVNKNMCRECRLKHRAIYEFASRVCECVSVHLSECLKDTKRTERRRRLGKGIGHRRSNFKVSTHLFVICKILHKICNTHRNFEIFIKRFAILNIYGYINIYILLDRFLYKRDRWVKI